ncbi:MAG: MBL fold metallo-hydrolase [Deltaproteobacteria bacterium]|nr:MBL fold metallo-hydrolase [Deltaproteobacteria bacterium]
MGQGELWVVYDNKVAVEGAKPGWGFACLIRAPGVRVLFDTGAEGETLLGNMALLKLDPRDIEHVVLSHEHWDHTGGLGALLGRWQAEPAPARQRELTVWVPESFSERFTSKVEQLGARVERVSGPCEIAPGVWSTGQVEGPMAEQGIVLEAQAGRILITGCAHPGITAMTERARELGPVELVLGGFHLMSTSPAEVGEIIERLKKVGVLRAGPCHCTGDRAIRMFAEAYGEHFVEIGAGSRLDWAPASRAR